MAVAGIVAEYNPFHTGHAYQVEQTRRALGAESAVVAVMSGNWVQQADCAVADKWTRARLALMGGVDLGRGRPTGGAPATAEGFARGAVAILAATGVVDTLSFGSECGDVEALDSLAQCLDSEEYRRALREKLRGGAPFAACRQAAVGELVGAETAALLRRANNNLGVEYLRAIKALGSAIVPMTVLRQGAGHNAVFSREGEGEEAAAGAMPPFLSATQIRMDLMEGAWTRAEPYLLPGSRAVLEQRMVGLPALERVSAAMLARWRTMDEGDWAALSDAGAEEGLPRRLVRAGREAGSVEEFFRLAQTKRYTHARLRRLVLRAYLGIRREDIPQGPLYLRVLGLNERGQSVLREMKGRCALPILTKSAHARALAPPGRALFELEARCTDLYGLCLPHIPPGGWEWRETPARLGGNGI